MRTLICLALAVFTLVGCSSYEEDYRHTSGSYYPSNNGYYGGDSGGYSSGYYGGGTTVYQTNNYSTYYPFGNVYYPRDRIWIVGTYGGCNYYSYRGYCYRYRDDFDRVIIWDRQHGYDDNWYRRRQDWCRYHDCHHDDIVRDSKGRPIQPQHIERDGMQSVPSRQPAPRTSYPVYKTDNNRSRWDRHDNDDDDHGRDRDRSSHSSSDDRQPVVRYAPQPVTRDTNSSDGSMGVGQPQSVPSQPVIQHSRPVFMPRNNNSGWGGSAGGSNSDSSSRSSQMPSTSAPATSHSSDSQGTSRNQSSGGNGNGRQRQWNQRGRGASGDEQ